MRIGAQLLHRLRVQLSSGFLIGDYFLKDGNHCFALPALEFENYTICIPECPEVRDFVQSEEFNRYQMQPQRCGVIFLDLIEFSDYDDETQLKILVRYQCEVKRIIEDMQIEKCISIGDGTIFIINNENIGSVLNYAIEILRALQDFNEEFMGKGIPQISCRIGIHVGNAYLYNDISRDTNYVGSGINFAQRVCSCVPFPRDNSIPERERSSIYVSSYAYEEFLNREIDERIVLEDLGEKEIKRGKLHVYALHLRE